jgi:hypothetical protein
MRMAHERERTLWQSSRRSADCAQCRINVCIVVDNVGRHECGEVVAKGSNLLVDVDEKGIRGPATENLNCAVWDLVKM